MVIPAELLQVNYAAEIREFLCRFYGRITLVTFRGLVFSGIQQEVLLFLGDRNGHTVHGIRTVELTDAEGLLRLIGEKPGDDELKPISRSGEKWSQYFLSTEEILLLRSLRANPQLAFSGRLIDADVGIVTGENQFFVLPKQAVELRALCPYVRPIVSRSNHLRGLVFSQSDWEDNVQKQAPAYLFVPPDMLPGQLPDPVRAYVAEGEKRGIHRGYKCRIRTPWYGIRSAWVPDAFMLRQVHGHPKIVLNRTSATCTDTLHRLRFRPGVDGRLVAVAFINSLTFAFAELTGRSYGGGVLTFEPSEAEALPLPLSGAENLDLDLIDTLLREKRIEGALDIADECLLIRGLGLSRYEASTLRNIWVTLRDRRIHRCPQSLSGKRT
jgi:adenine-specific DNA-methyltransferase